MTRKRRRLTFLGVVSEFLLVAGLVSLGFVGYQLLWTDAVSLNAQDKVVQEMIGEAESPEQACVGPLRTGASPPIISAESNAELMGIVMIPRLGDYAVPVYEGVGKDVINGMGIGHYPTTQSFGEIGNAGIGAHRTTYGSNFRNIDQLQVGDDIVIRGDDACLVYKVVGSDIVSPRDNGVLDPVPEFLPDAHQGGRYLTLTTCDPLFSRTNRLIVWAELEGWMNTNKDVQPELNNGIED